MSVRLRRLQSDAEQVQNCFRGGPLIVVRKAVGNPPERYEIEYRIRGLVVQEDGQIVESTSHVAEITLTKAYPHRAPYCKMLTPIFHPNISPGAICIGDHWAASESLSDLIIRIGQLIAYQAYNTKSPLNGEAARWADGNKPLLPVDSRELVPPEREPASPPPLPLPPEAATGVEQCQNCGATSPDVLLTRCAGDHVTCPDCITQCRECGATLCLACRYGDCTVCGAKGCLKCFTVCPNCERMACPEHTVLCATCGRPFCHECAGTCPDCGRTLCTDHLTACRSCERPLCLDCSTQCDLCAPEVEHHRSDLARCQECGALVCQEHQHVSIGSGTGCFCDSCGRPCSNCHRWVADSEMASCTECGVVVCPACARECQSCRKAVCPNHAITCHVCGKTACRECAYVCPVCGKNVCKARAHVGRCAICGKVVCSKCLRTCSDCKTTACSTHMLNCPFCGKEVCRKWLEACASCKTQHHKAHVVVCKLCGRRICPKCAVKCDHCKRAVCVEHIVPSSSGQGLCVPCFDRKDRKTALIFMSAFLGVLLLLGLVVYLISL